VNQLFSVTFAISLLVNILGFLLGIWLLARKGGLPHTFTKLPFIPQPKLKNPIVYPIRYFYRRSLFEVLPASADKVIFLGDSNVENCEWAELFNNPNLINRGLGGETTEGLLTRLADVLKCHPSKLFVMVGVNDFNAGLSAEQIIYNYRRILQETKAKTPQTQVFVQSVLPVNKNFDHKKVKANNKTIIEFNSKLQALAEEFSYQYVDLFPALANDSNQLDQQYTLDGIHLTGLGYLAWKQVIQQWLTESTKPSTPV
jgi:lysophospholipase L1-like esterase